MLLTESRLRKIIAEEYKLMMKEVYHDPTEPRYKERPLSDDKGTGIRPKGELPGLENPVPFRRKTKPTPKEPMKAYSNLMDALANNPEHLMNALVDPDSSPLGKDIKTLKADKDAAHSAKFSFKGMNYEKADKVYKMLFPQQS